MQTTFSIIKPDAIKRNLEGEILNYLQKANFKILALKKTKFSLEQAAQFYIEHKGKDFYSILCKFLSSGPIVCCVLEKDNAIEDYRILMGDTNPQNAKVGTLRNLYGLSLDENSVHGADSIESAKREIEIMFHPSEIFD